METCVALDRHVSIIRVRLRVPVIRVTRDHHQLLMTMKIAMILTSVVKPSTTVTQMPSAQIQTVGSRVNAINHDGWAMVAIVTITIHVGMSPVASTPDVSRTILIRMAISRVHATHHSLVRASFHLNVNVHLDTRM